MNNLEFVISDLKLSESIYLKNQVSEIKNTPSFNGLYNKDIESVYNLIVLKFNDSLSDFQVRILSNLFDTFSFISHKIDPLRLKFEYIMNSDDELIIFRTTENSIINLIINPDDDIALSIIKKTGEKKLEFYHENDDLEKVSYLFFSF